MADLASALIGSAATLVGALVGFGAVVWQIGRQARLASSQQRQTEIIKLKLRIYEDAIQICDRVTNAEVSFATFVTMFVFSLRNAADQRARGIVLSPPPQRFSVLQDHQSATSMAAIEVITTVERWAIVDPRLEIFQTAINVALHDIMLAYQRFYPRAMQAFPIDMPQADHALPWNPPPREIIDSIERDGDNLRDALGLLGAFMHDFRIEMQQAMLSDLFQNTPRKRLPIDARFLAITLDRHEELGRHFENETSWGKAKAESEARARQAIIARG